MSSVSQRPSVPTPVLPDDGEAWYAPTVRSQSEIFPAVVVTVHETDQAFAYDVREPPLTADERDALESVEQYFGGAHLERPRTREGAVERMERGFEPKHERVLDRLLDQSPAARRRIDYRALSSLTCLGELTPYALDDRIDVADVSSDAVVVHTERYAPARTTLDRRLDRILPDNLMYRLETPHGDVGYEMPSGVTEGRATATTQHGAVTLRVWYA